MCVSSQSTALRNIDLSSALYAPSPLYTSHLRSIRPISALYVPSLLSPPVSIALLRRPRPSSSTRRAVSARLRPSPSTRRAVSARLRPPAAPSPPVSAHQTRRLRPDRRSETRPAPPRPSLHSAMPGMCALFTGPELSWLRVGTLFFFSRSARPTRSARSARPARPAAAAELRRRSVRAGPEVTIRR